MSRLHRSESKTRTWPEDRVDGAQRRHGREIIRAEIDQLDDDVVALDEGCWWDEQDFLILALLDERNRMPPLVYRLPLRQS